MGRRAGPIIAAALLVAAVRVFTVPGGFWEAGEVRLAAALLTFDPARGQPPGWGHPLLIGMARLVNVFIRDPFLSLVSLSVAGSVAAAVLTALAVTRLAGHVWLGAGVAIVALLSPGMLLFGALPVPASVTAALVAATLYFLTGRRPEPFAASAAAAIGVQPQIAPAMAVFFVMGLMGMPRRGRAAVIFLALLALCFIPVVEAAGGDAVLLGESMKAALAPQKALIARFVTHPWGPKALALPLLGAAAAGFFLAMRGREKVAGAALASFALVHILVCVSSAGGGDGVLPVLPAVIPVAFFAVTALIRWPSLAVLASLAFAAGSLAYAGPAARVRAWRSGPAAVAARQATRTLPGNTVVVAAPDLAPFASISGTRLEFITPERYDDYAGRGADVHLLMHGRSPSPGAITFVAAADDATRKLTSDRFHIVSLIPQPPPLRYVGGSGVYEIESSTEAGEWRWLGPVAIVELPPAPYRRVTLHFRLPDYAPLERNRISIGDATVELGPGSSAQLEVPDAGALTIRAERSFAPGDGRDLAVQLIGLERR